MRSYLHFRRGWLALPRGSGDAPVLLLLLLLPLLLLLWLLLSPSAGTSFVVGPLGRAPSPLSPSLSLQRRAYVKDTTQLGSLQYLGQASTREEVDDILAPYLCRWKSDPKLANKELFQGALKQKQRLAAAPTELALWVLGAMRAGAVEVNVFHFTSAMHCCATGSAKGGALAWPLVMGLLGEMLHLGIRPTAVSYGAAISAADWSTALELLRASTVRGVMPDSVSCNSCIAACGRGGQWHLSLALLRAMPEARLAADEFSVASATGALAKASWSWAWQLALSLLGLEPATSRLATTGNSHATGEGSLVSGETRSLAHSRRSVVGYNSALSALSTASRWQLALGVLSQMPEVRLAPDKIT
ncbi:unnamed protein product, partial [Polarella glacialis]